MAFTPTSSKKDDVHYTVLIRLPFPRGDFVDPPLVDWNSTKERELWSVISSTPFGQELDLQAIADRFDVPLPFLTQQIAWLFERHRSQLSAQVRKISRPLSIGTSPTPGYTSESGTTGPSTGVRGASGGSRGASSLSHRPKERTASHGDGSKEMPHTAGGTPVSRTTLTNTVTQTQNSTPSASPPLTTERQSSLAYRNRSVEHPRRPVEASPRQAQRASERTASPSTVASDPSTTSSSDSEAPHPVHRSRTFARRPRYSSSKATRNLLSDADEDDEDPTPFLPFSDARTVTPPPPTDPGATVKISPKRPPSQRQAPSPITKLRAPNLPQTTHSSSSSAQSQPPSQHRPSRNPLSTLSPRQRRIAKEGSDGTPSMGSSFSDLEDASVTQSAMEEALASNMNRGGMASRVSTFSQALRSKYLPGVDPKITRV